MLEFLKDISVVAIGIIVGLPLTLLLTYWIADKWNL